mgnify:CR=1 FL=1
MMNTLTPFERTGYELFRSMRDWENAFFGGQNQLSACKTYVMEAELPGFSKDEIQVDVQEDVLTLKAVHKEKSEEEQAKDGTYLRKERSSCSYQQQMYVGDVDTDHMEASYENGILTLKMPKKQPVVPESRQITIQ